MLNWHKTTLEQLQVLSTNQSVKICDMVASNVPSYNDYQLHYEIGHIGLIKGYHFYLPSKPIIRSSNIQFIPETTPELMSDINLYVHIHDAERTWDCLKTILFANNGAVKNVMISNPSYAPLMHRYLEGLYAFEKNARSTGLINKLFNENSLTRINIGKNFFKIKISVKGSHLSMLTEILHQTLEQQNIQIINVSEDVASIGVLERKQGIIQEELIHAYSIDRNNIEVNSQRRVQGASPPSPQQNPLLRTQDRLKEKDVIKTNSKVIVNPIELGNVGEEGLFRYDLATQTLLNRLTNESASIPAKSWTFFKAWFDSIYLEEKSASNDVIFDNLILLALDSLANPPQDENALLFILKVCQTFLDMFLPQFQLHPQAANLVNALSYHEEVQTLSKLVLDKKQSPYIVGLVKKLSFVRKESEYEDVKKLMSQQERDLSVLVDGIPKNIDSSPKSSDLQKTTPTPRLTTIASLQDKVSVLDGHEQACSSSQTSSTGSSSPLTPTRSRSLIFSAIEAFKKFDETVTSKEIKPWSFKLV